MEEMRIVSHKNQKVVEYWKHHSTFGWMIVSKSDGQDWVPGTYNYVELIHSMDMRKDGSYGPYIIG
jgi:hypothetical protein